MNKLIEMYERGDTFTEMLQRVSRKRRPTKAKLLAEEKIINSFFKKVPQKSISLVAQYERIFAYYTQLKKFNKKEGLTKWNQIQIDKEILRIHIHLTDIGQQIKDYAASLRQVDNIEKPQDFYRWYTINPDAELMQRHSLHPRKRGQYDRTTSSKTELSPHK